LREAGLRIVYDEGHEDERGIFFVDFVFFVVRI
jgi:hypothetical protein